MRGGALQIVCPGSGGHARVKPRPGAIGCPPPFDVYYVDRYPHGSRPLRYGDYLWWVRRLILRIRGEPHSPRYGASATDPCAQIGLRGELVVVGRRAIE